MHQEQTQGLGCRVQGEQPNVPQSYLSRRPPILAKAKLPEAGSL